MESDPPPDLAVEIDTTNESFSKFSIYAVLSVPEMWHCDGKIMRFYGLSDTTYAQISESRCMPGIQPMILASTLKLSKDLAQTPVLRTFWEQIRGIRRQV